MDFGWIQRHPYLTGLGVLGVGLVVVFAARGGGGGQITTVAGTTPQQTQADLQYRIAQLGAQASAGNTAAALEAKRIESATALELAGIGKELEALSIAASQAVATASIASQDKVTAAQLEAIRIQSATAIEGLKVQTGAQLQSQQIQAQLEDTRMAREQYNLQTAIRLQADNQLYATQASERQNNALVALLASSGNL